MVDLRQARLRSSPHFRLVGFDQLSNSELEVFRSLSRDPDCFGLLIPPDGSVLPVKSVSRDAALLFLALREPACRPHLLQTLFGAEVDARVRQLVLDGVFEVEQAGQFVSGAAALEPAREAGSGESHSRVARLSQEAIGYAVALEGLPAHEVATRLYLYNTAPGGPELHRRFDSDERTLAFLCRDDAMARWLQSRWRHESVGDSWLGWHGDVPSGSSAYKLYVSPTLEHLPRIFEAAIRAFAQAGCSYFKLGRGAHGLLRPDKLVAYFSGLEALQQASEQIRMSAHAAAAQGVPFTAPIDSDGLLSWGMDPPRLEQVMPSQQTQSWRQWLTGRVALYALAAREAGADALSFVRERIHLDGIDPATWTPNLAIWREPLGSGQGAA